MRVECGEENRTINTMHVVEIELDLLRWFLCCCCVIDGAIDHLRCFGLQLIGRDGPLLGVGNHFLRSTNEDAVADFVPVFPVGSRTEFFVCAYVIEELRERFGSGCRGGGFGFEEVGCYPRVVDAGLC